MTTRLFTNPRSLQERCDGPLGPHIDAYAARLREQGYSYEAARNQLRVIADLSRWLQRRNLTATDVGPGAIARYVQDCKRRHAHVADTYWYLTAYPELMGLATQRLEQRWEDWP